MKKVRLSEIRAEVLRLNAAGKTVEAAELWREGVTGMYAGRYEEDTATARRSFPAESGLKMDKNTRR